MSVKQSIKVTNAGLSPILSVAQGTDAIEYEFTVSDFDIPSGSAAVAYNIQPTGNIVSQTCSISGNTITIKPPAYYFLRGKNYMQFQVSRNNEDLFSFLIEVWCAPNISQPEVIVAENPSLVSQLISDVGLLSSQLDNLLSIPPGSLSTSADAALADIKVGWDGTTYDTPGDAVRGQIGELKDDLRVHSDIISSNLMGIDVQENLYSGAADWSGEWTNTDTIHVGLTNETFMGYPVMYSSESWRRYYKTIPVVAGKTYTFEAWIKHATVGSAFLYLIYDNTQNPATLSANSKQFNDTPANTWTKLSLTFTCTTSGNITPFVLSAKGAFYFTKYVLVEGGSVFNLANALDAKASIESVSGVGDYLKYNLSLGTSPGTYWNNDIKNPISTGTKVKLVFDSYSGDYLSYVRIDGKKGDNTYTNALCKINNPVHGEEAEFIASEDYVELRVQFYRLQNESYVTASIYIATDSVLGITNELMSMPKRRIFHVEKDGSGDFTSFIEAINTACQYMDSVVYVGAGTYDLLDELGDEYISNASGQKMGIVLKNRVHVICSSQTILAMKYDGSLSNAKEYLSPINTGIYGCILENATIVDNNVRYSVHDDQGWSGSIPYTNKFINCTFIHKNGMYGDCIGGGLGENCNIEIRGCYLEGDVNVERLAYYHGNNHTGIINAKGNIIVCDNYFANKGAFWLNKYGDSTEMTTALVSNNSFGSEPKVVASANAQDNMRMIAWNNEIRS